MLSALPLLPCGAQFLYMRCRAETGAWGQERWGTYHTVLHFVTKRSGFSVVVGLDSRRGLLGPRGDRSSLGHVHT